jgi:DNA end-binding protein Ku
LACIRAANGVILMETLFWPDEVRSTNELPNIHSEANVTEQELKMAVTLIGQLTTSFQPEKYVDEHRNEVMAMIERKVANQEVATSPAVATKQDNIVDLMKALQESLKATKPAKRTTRKKSS